MTATKTQFEIIDHVIDYADYFQGCGTSCTPYENVATGIGDNPADAMDDCLDQIAMAADLDALGFESNPDVKRWLSETSPSVQEYLAARESAGMDESGCPCYRVSIRW